MWPRDPAVDMLLRVAGNPKAVCCVAIRYIRQGSRRRLATLNCQSDPSYRSFASERIFCVNSRVPGPCQPDQLPGGFYGARRKRQVAGIEPDSELKFLTVEHGARGSAPKSGL